MTAISRPTPDVHSIAGLPARVRIYEVGPRDGLQNVGQVVDLGVKAELIERLVASGVRSIELTSMVRPDRVPQLADAEALLRRLSLPDDVLAVVLVPNERGLARAIELGVREVAIFTSATETFSHRNLGRSIDDSFRMFEPVVNRARDEGIDVRAYVSMCFGDPWEGSVPIEQVVAVALRVADLGCSEVSIGDTIGTGTPGHVRELIGALQRVGIGPERLAVHFHDSFGQALANVYAALECGVATVDASAGGLGGCPYASGASGNVATEDVVWQLAGLGIETGIDLAALVDTSLWLAEHLGGPPASLTTRALAARRLSASAIAAPHA